MQSRRCNSRSIGKVGRRSIRRSVDFRICNTSLNCMCCRTQATISLICLRGNRNRCRTLFAISAPAFSWPKKWIAPVCGSREAVIGKPATASRDPQTGAIHFFGHEKAGAEIANKVLQRLRFPRKQINEIVACVRQHMQFKDVLQMRKSTLRRMLLRPTFPIERELHRLDCLGSHGRLDHYEFLVRQEEQLERQPAIRPPLLTGDDLLDMGMKPGPLMGRLLAELREKQLQDELRTTGEARVWAQKQLDQT